MLGRRKLSRELLPCTEVNGGYMDKRIKVYYYDCTGRFVRDVTYPNSVDAFNALQWAGLDAMAHPEGTTSGSYHWQGRQDGHTLEGFKAKLELCCNDPFEYSCRLQKAGYY